MHIKWSLTEVRDVPSETPEAARLKESSEGPRTRPSGNFRAIWEAQLSDRPSFLQIDFLRSKTVESAYDENMISKEISKEQRENYRET